MKFSMLLTASCAALSVAVSSTTAFAQSGGESGARTSQDEVIVTATRRAEKLSEVPIAISVFGADDVDQTSIRELSELSEYIPNVEISGHNDFRSVITIRGVGSNSRNIGFDSRVGVYVDGVYMGQSPAVNQELLDLERVEVLRGPQGMLFGKNTVAGAISLVTKKPSFDDFSAKVTADIGNYDYREFKGIVNLPLSDIAAAKFSIAKTDRDGYIKNISTGNYLDTKDVWAYRAQLRLQPTNNFEANFAFDGLNADNLILVGEPLTDTFGVMSVPFAPEKRQVAFNFDPSENRDIYGGAADLEYRFDNGFILKSITGVRDTHAYYTNATDYAPIDLISIQYTDKFRQYSEELQLISPSDSRLTYMAGLYLYKQKAHTQRDVILGYDFYESFIGPVVGPSVAPLLMLDPNNLSQAELALIASVVGFGPEGSLVYNSGDVETKSIAGYINGSFDFTDRLTLGFGGRYSIETKEVNWLLDGRNSGLFFIGSTGTDPLNPSPLVNDRTDKFFSPAVSLSYAITDSANAYAKFSSGYKSGGFNLDYINANELAANSGLEFDKETVDSYELGLKSSFFDKRLTLNIAAFLSNYDNYQVNQFVDLGGGRTSIRITNAASVKTKGVEVEFSLQATDDLMIQGSAGYLDADFDSFPGGGTAGADASGKKLINAPEFSAAIGGVYMRDIPAIDSTFMMRADLTYTGGQFTTVDNIKSVTLASTQTVPYGFIDEMTLVNGRIGLMMHDDMFEVFLWGRNLTNTDGLVDDFRDFFGTLVNHPNIGRTYGVGIVANF
ncbi:MAG TPA: TonB-dependent receptor [Parvularculaceae bacterium]|nr:TonB-dependent receptor [Caulobacterales bacterium]HPE30850.1 TonB-dependent receptor [Parvularculaceae bacterium]